jgi:hypothetical protein
MRNFAFRGWLLNSDLIVLVLVPFLIHWPELSGWLSSNPLYIISGLTREGWALNNGPLPGQPGWIDGHAGVTLQALGGLVAQDWLSGKIPWWNPYSGVGLPLAAESQPAAFFLPFVLLLRLWEGVLYLKITLQVVAGVATWFLLRRLSLARPVAALGAILFELNGSFAWFADPNMMPIAFLPVLILGIEQAYVAACQHRSGGWRLIGIAVAYSVTAGFPETAYIDGLLALAWAACRLAQAGDRWRAFIGKVLGGGIPGLLLTVPLLLPFGEYLSRASLEGHATLAHAAVPAAAWAMFLFPYIYGPIFFGGQLDLWYSVGGFIGLPLLFAALYGLVIPGRERALRITLGVWVVLALAKTGDAAGISWLINRIPPVHQMMFFRYACVSWEFAVIVLSSFGLDHWLRGLRLSTWRWRVVYLVVAACIVTVLFGGRHMIGLLLSQANYPAYLAGSLAWGLSLTALLAAILSQSASDRKIMFVCCILGMDAIAQFSLPLLAGVRRTELDMGAVRYLKQNLGLQRFYTLGPFLPNYGAYFRLASINHNYVPVDRSWVDYIRMNLDPGASDAVFNGLYPPPQQDRWEALREHLTGFEAVGVKFVIAPPGWALFNETPVGGQHAPLIPLPLTGGQKATGSLPPGSFGSGTVTGIRMLIGTYHGQARGHLLVELCSANACTHGSADLDTAADNAPVEVPLSPPLQVDPAAPVRYRIDYPAGRQVAIWAGQMAGAEIAGPTAVRPGLAPQFWLEQAGGASRPRLVYKGFSLDIYELPHPASYFEAVGSTCAIEPVSRTQVVANCTGPAMLVRRELFYPGWGATVNGRAVPITEYDSVFQKITVPQGISEIRFAYRPLYIDWAWTAAAVGAFWIIAGSAISTRLRRLGTAKLPMGDPTRAQ